MLHVGLIPLDERPVNTRYPVQIARIAGADVRIPPAAALSHFREPASFDALSDWLLEQLPALDALIVSIEMLGYGGLIASRISDEPGGAIFKRLDLLGTIRKQRPDLPILGFNVITRISRHNDATEEPLYWAQHGANLFRLSQLMDRWSLGQSVIEEYADLIAEVPAEYVVDFLARRDRNHVVNHVVITMLMRGEIDTLVLSSDDTSQYGLGVKEKRELIALAGRYQLGERLLMYPGADEVGCVLAARLINQAAGRTPRFQVVYAVPGGESIVAAFEDGPVHQTVERQVIAAGAVIVPEDEPFDVRLIVNPPLGPDADWPRPYTEAERGTRLPPLEAAVQQIKRALQEGERVAVADVAHANGTDNLFFDLLCAEIDLSRLAAYAAWNTAGNTIGTVIAQACAALSITDDSAQQAFLLHRMIEDWAYQANVRDDVRGWLEAQTGQREPSSDQLVETRAQIETRLQARLDQLPGFAAWCIAPGSVRLPWRRTFEVDFDLEKRG